MWRIVKVRFCACCGIWDASIQRVVLAIAFVVYCSWSLSLEVGTVKLKD